MRNKKKQMPQMIIDKNQLSMYLSQDDINVLVNENLMPIDVKENYIKVVSEGINLSKQFAQFYKENPFPSDDQINNFLKNLKPRTSDQAIKDCHSIQRFQEIVQNNWDNLIALLSKDNSHTSGLFNAVDVKESFGIPRQVTDPVNRIKELMEAAVLINEDNTFVIEGRINDSYGNNICLKYELDTESEIEAKKLFNSYKSIMLSKGIKILMGYWRTANKKYSIIFTCPMIEIMKETSSEDRESPFFSVKEKKEHWKITKMLTKTRLSIEKNQKKGKTSWIEQPLIEIIGGEKEINETYPEIIAVSVLRPQQDIKYFPAIYKNNTMQLHPNDIYLAFYIQTRASQLNKGENKLRLDWNLLIWLGGLENTAVSNQRVAKMQIRKKLNRLLQKNIIDDWTEYSDGVFVSPKSQKK